MGRIFNVSAACKPELHYMVNMEEPLKQIKIMVDQGLYFTINRARQYGKTTILHALEQFLKEEYIVISLDFQIFSAANFRTEKDFIENFSAEILGCVSSENIPEDIQKQLEWMADGAVQNDRLPVLFRCLSRWCGLSAKKIVYDIKNLKNKFVEEHKMNSPWNIAADFDIDLRLMENGIAGMLSDYEEDHRTGMDIQKIAGLIYDYTSGYPFLVSRICKLMDEKVYRRETDFDRSKAWTKEGFLTAVRMLLTEENTLFDSLDNKLIDYPDLKQMLQELLLQGKVIEYVPGNMGIRMGVMFGFVTIENYIVNVSNRIFETRLYNGFLAEKSRDSELAQTAALEKNQFIAEGRLDMEQVIRKFVCYYQDIFGDLNEKFLEDNGRCLFLLYIKPIINGTGNYYIEAKTRTNRRTDLIIDYCGEQHIVELKIWRGQEYNKRGEEQLTDYLDLYHAKQGYLVSFNFNKKKKTGVERLRIKDKIIFEAVV